MELGYVVIAATSAIAGLLLRRFVPRSVARWLAVAGCVALVAAVTTIFSVFVGLAPTMSAFMWALLR